MKNFNYFPAKFITKNFILIDGISRTGKLLLGSLICSFDRMESLEFGENFEHLLPAVKFKKVNKRFAKAFLHNYLNQLIYNKFISRNVNFRLNDRTSIEQSRNPKIYYKRLKNLDGDIVLGRIQKEEPIILEEIKEEIQEVVKPQRAEHCTSHNRFKKSCRPCNAAIAGLTY